MYVPSKLGWGVHKKAHDCLKELPRIPGRRFEVSIGLARQWLDKVTTETWQRVYWPHLEYKGRQFYELYTNAPTGRNARREATLLLPTSKKGGTWLPALANKSNVFVARFTRAVLNHAPIGEYYERFHIDEDVMCQGCGRRETRNHILTGCIWSNCRRYTRRDKGREFDVDTIPGLIKFLELNPHVFSFKEQVRNRQGVG